MHITALLTCYNRRNKTLRCLSGLQSMDLPAGARLFIVLVDDNSSDGTADAVCENFPEVEVLSGSGQLYWCGGMRKAWQHAALSDPDYYLLVNDDTIIQPYAFSELHKIVGAPTSRTIGVGAIMDPVRGTAAYGGRGGARGSKLIAPTGRPEPCVTLNANLALVTREVFKELGILHDAYTHGLGDYDYGFQATRAGIPIYQTPGFVGACKQDTYIGSFCDTSLPRFKRLQLIQSPKGLPFKEWVIYNRRNTGWLWPYRCITPYLRILLGM